MLTSKANTQQKLSPIPAEALHLIISNSFIFIIVLNQQRTNTKTKRKASNVMISCNAFKTIALSFPCTEEKPHFDRTAFKISKKKIFATLHEKSGTANLLLSPEDQSVFCLIDKTKIFAVANKWGFQGWTTFELKTLSMEFITDALQQAYKNALVSKKKK